MKIENSDIRDLLIRLKKVHDIYKVATEEQRGRLLDACQGIFDKLDSLTGLPRTFHETLVIGGKDFLDSLYPQSGVDEVASEYDAKVIFS
jgi:hypothetical protein